VQQSAAANASSPQSSMHGEVPESDELPDIPTLFHQRPINTTTMQDSTAQLQPNEPIAMQRGSSPSQV